MGLPGPRLTMMQSCNDAAPRDPFVFSLLLAGAQACLRVAHLPTADRLLTSQRQPNYEDPYHDDLAR